MRVPKGFVLDLIAVTALISAAATLVGGFIHFYQQGVFLEAVSYSTEERPFNAIVTSLLGVPEQSTLWGIHAFGDYLLTHYWITLDSPWLETQTDTINYLPSVLVVFEALGLLPYRWGLGVYQVAMIVALAFPMAYALKGYRWSIRILGVVVLAILTGPAIASLDRANTQGFIPILLFGFALMVLKGRWGWATALLIAAASIKIFPLVLVLLFIALRKWIPALLAVVGTAVVSLVALPIVSSDFWSTVPLVFTDPLSYTERTFNDFMIANVSPAGSLAHLAQTLGLSDVSAWIAGHGSVVGLVFLAAAAPLLWFTALPLWLRIIIAMSMTAGVMPVAFPYALNWVLAASALVAYTAGPRYAGGSPIRMPRGLSVPLVISLALLSAIYPVLWPGSMESGIPVGAAGIAALVALLLLLVASWAYVAREPLLSKQTFH